MENSLKKHLKFEICNWTSAGNDCDCQRFQLSIRNDCAKFKMQSTFWNFNFGAYKWNGHYCDAHEKENTP